MNRFSVLIFAAVATVSTMTFASDLQVNLQNTNAYVIDTSTRSCTLQVTDPSHQQSDDISSMFVNFAGFMLNWTGSQPLILDYIQISIPELGGTPVTVGGLELAYLWAGTNTMSIIPANTMISSSPSCNWSVGGLQVPNKSLSSSGQGTLLVYGTSYDQAGNPVSVSASTNFSYHYVAPNGN